MGDTASVLVDELSPICAPSPSHITTFNIPTLTHYHPHTPPHTLHLTHYHLTHHHLTHYHPHTLPLSHITLTLYTSHITTSHITLTFYTSHITTSHITISHITTSHIITLTHYHPHTSPSHIITLTHFHPHTPQDQLPLHIAYTPVSESIHCSALDIHDTSCSKKYRASKPSCTMFTIRAMLGDK